jgi:hypothetical protein
MPFYAAFELVKAWHPVFVLAVLTKLISPFADYAD